jgi:hypothetical protein
MDYKNSNREPSNGQGKRWGKIATATKIARAVTGHRGFWHSRGNRERCPTRLWGP